MTVLPKIKKFSERFLINQRFNSYLFKSSKRNYEKKIYNFIEQFASQNKNNIKSKDLILGTVPIIKNFYGFLINILKIRSVLEIGTFLGSFSIFVAQSRFVKKVVTIEKYKKFFNIAKSRINEHRLNKKIKILLGDANILLKKKINYKFDLIYLDGSKQDYLELFKIIEKYNMSKKSIILIDDIFFHGDTLNKIIMNKKTEGVLKLLNYLKKNKKNYNITILPIANGLLLLQLK